jgi:hypothetical protein
MVRLPQILLVAATLATPLAAQAPPAPACDARGLERETVTKMTDVLLDMGFVGFEKIEIVDGCFRVAAKNPAGDLVVLTFDSFGELIGLGLGTGGASPRFAPSLDGVRETD